LLDLITGEWAAFLVDNVAQAAVGVFARQEASTDTALIFDGEEAATLPVDTGEREAGAALVELYEIPGSRTTGWLINLSVRTNICPAGETIVVGFVLGGRRKVSC